MKQNYEILKKRMQCIQGSLESCLYLCESLRDELNTATRTHVKNSLDNICEILVKLKNDSETFYDLL